MTKSFNIILFITLAAILLSGCSVMTLPSGKNSSSDAKKIDSKLIDSNNRFAFNIFRQINKEDENKSIFISPLSISAALSMTYLGSGTETRKAMAKALEYSEIGDNILNGSYSNLLPYLRQLDNKVELNISNSLWIREGEVIKEDFIKANKSIFDASINYQDFSDDKAADIINKWISDATNRKIEKMLEPPISPDVVMYLINAIYFKGDWTYKFNEKDTYNTEFNGGSSTSSQVKMMSRKGKAEYGQGDGYKAVRLPYGNGKTAMYCILPEEGIAINDFISGLDGNKWNDIRESISERDEVTLKLPRFKLEYGIKSLNDSLTTLGMGVAFTDAADFSGIRDGICIGRVLHKAVIEVNEDGSEAAAATVVEMRETAAAEPIAFIANHPFVFVIADDTTGTILFMGKVFDL